jgi:hypothetical protein
LEDDIIPIVVVDRCFEVSYALEGGAAVVSLEADGGRKKEVK